jgi:hypothetical protein
MWRHTEPFTITLGNFTWFLINIYNLRQGITILSESSMNSGFAWVAHLEDSWANSFLQSQAKVLIECMLIKIHRLIFRVKRFFFLYAWNRVIAVTYQDSNGKLTLSSPHKVLPHWTLPIPCWHSGNPTLLQELTVFQISQIPTSTECGPHCDQMHSKVSQQCYPLGLLGFVHLESCAISSCWW